MPARRSSRSENSESNELVDPSGQRLPNEETRSVRSRDSNTQASIQLKDNNDEHDSVKELDPDESGHLWADLKAETGHDSYIEYLEACKEDYPYAQLIKECFLDAWRYQGVPHQTCAIFNLQIGPSSCPSLDLQCSSGSAATILSALRQSSPPTEVRVVLWEASMLGRAMLNALGLGLKIHPDSFRALLVRHCTADYLRVILDDMPLPWRELVDGFDERGIAPDVVLLGQYLVTTARHYLSANLDAPPVIMIFRLDRPSPLTPEKKAKNKFSRASSSQEPAPPANANPINVLPRWMQGYVRLLKLDLEKRRGRSSSVTDLKFKPLSPLLQFYVVKFREECDSIRAEYLDFTLPETKLRYDSELLNQGPRRKGRGKIKGLRELFDVRYLLRRLVEDSEQQYQQLRMFTRSQSTLGTPLNEPSTEIEDQLQQAHLEAHRLETEIREYLQLQTGELSLQASRKSIELSSSQIEETKRVKIFTILAFVYVPLNLATSIFGMNLEQLNGNGQHVRVFLITAMVALTITGGSWFIIEQVNSYRKWQRRSSEEQYGKSTHSSLAVRLAMIALLHSKGHTHWMFKSGAWWRVIIDHRSRFVGPYDYGDGSLTACEYLSRYIQSGRDFVVGLSFLNGLHDCHWTSAPKKDDMRI